MVVTQELAEQARLALEQAERDPAAWVRTVLGDELWGKQREILESVRDYRTVAVASCHSSGKSFAAARLVLWWLFTYKPSIVLTLAPTDRQVRRILWKEIAVAYRRAEARGLKWGARLLTQELRFSDDWWAMGFAAPEYDPDKFQGFHAPHMLVILDEAAGFSQPIVDAVESLLSGEHARLLLIGNPTDPTSPFARIFKDVGTKRIHISAFDTPNFTAFGITEEDIAKGVWQEKITGPLPYSTLVTPEWVAERHRKWQPHSPAYVSRVRGEFPETSLDSLLQYSWIESAMQQERWDATKDLFPKVLGVDPARYGDNETVVVLREGDRARILETMRDMDTVRVAKRVAQLQAENDGAAIHIDAVGLGAGIYDYLKRIGRRVVALEASGAADDPETYSNKRAEWYWRLRDRFREGRIAIKPDDEMEGQLASLKYGFDGKDRILIWSKDDMRRHGLPSPDRADALMLAFAEAETFTDFAIDPSELDIGRRPMPWRV